MSTPRAFLFVLVATGLLMLPGCRLNTPQVDTVKRLLPFGNAKQKALDPFAWSFSVGGMQYRVYATTVRGNQVSFSNDFGMKILWDGDSFLSIENIPGGFGQYSSGREIDAKGQEGRWYVQQEAPVRRASCSPPRLWRLSDDRFGWRQNCRADIDGVRVSATHAVEFDSQSMVREIEASVFPGGPRFVLRRLNR